MEKSQSGGPTKSGGGGRPMPPDSGGKVKQKEKSLSIQQSGIAKLGLHEKMLKKVKKSKKKLWQPPT